MHLLRHVLVALVSAWAASAASIKPNVLFIAVDDLNNQLGCYGNAIVQSPNINRLAASGVRFDRAYTQLPLCSPSRVSLLTGLRPDTTRVYDLQTNFRKGTNIPNVITFPQLLRSNGWFVARVGKMFHYGVPGDIGKPGLDDPLSWDLAIYPRGRDKDEEDKVINLNRGEPNPERAPRAAPARNAARNRQQAANAGTGTQTNRNQPRQTNQLGAALAWHESEGTDNEFTDSLVADEAIRLLDQKRDKPFFLGVGFYRPHVPWIVPKKYFELYPMEKIALPFNVPNDRDDIPPPALWVKRWNYGRTDEEVRGAIRAYYASITYMDKQVGRVLDALDRLGLATNTIVILWGDHGWHLGEHGAWQKQSLFEESARVPLLIRVPGAKGNGSSCPRIVETLDLYPTVAEFCGVRAPDSVQGKSLMPLLKNPLQKWDRPAYSQTRRGTANNFFMGYSVRTDRWRYTEWDNGVRGAELYDHENDPREFTNLATNSNHAATIANLQRLLKKAKTTPTVQ
jgi:iduronate 2-sulfatase